MRIVDLTGGEEEGNAARRKDSVLHGAHMRTARAGKVAQGAHDFAPQAAEGAVRGGVGRGDVRGRSGRFHSGRGIRAQISKQGNKVPGQAL